MLFWFIAIAITFVTCAAVFFAARPVGIATDDLAVDNNNAHFRQLLDGIEGDQAAGKLSVGAAQAARAELAREVLRARIDAGKAVNAGPHFGLGELLVGLGLVVMLTWGGYGLLGSPDLPNMPLESRPEVMVQAIDLEQAIVRIEQQLAANPGDVRGWSVIAPVYRELGRYADAAAAYRQVMALSAPTPDLQTSFAEVLLLEADGAGAPEAMNSLRAAVMSNSEHILSRLYLAAELTRQGQYPEAVNLWKQVLALARGGEPWINVARQGLAVAENGGVEPDNDQESEMVGLMVSGLAARLVEQGGSPEEWAQLVCAYLVLGDRAQAQAAYDEAVKAYPQAAERGGMDILALGAGLELNGVQP